MKKDTYKIVNGTFYHAETSDKVINVLENCRADGTRILLDYGDVKTCVSWGDTYNVTGRVGRSTGVVKVPLLVHNSRSSGGNSIMSDCILSIRESNGGRYLYKLTV